MSGSVGSGDAEAGCRSALAKILPVQRSDYVELFEIMGPCR